MAVQDSAGLGNTMSGGDNGRDSGAAAAEYSIPVRVIGGDGPRLLVTGGVHGDEFEPMAACRRLIGLLETLVASEPAYII